MKNKQDMACFVGKARSGNLGDLYMFLLWNYYETKKNKKKKTCVYSFPDQIVSSSDKCTYNYRELGRRLPVVDGSTDELKKYLELERKYNSPEQQKLYKEVEMPR